MTPARRGPAQQMKCPRCESLDLRSVTIPATATTREGTVVNYVDEFTQCVSCQNEYYTKAQSRAHSAAISSAVRVAEGFYAPKAIRAIRLRFGLSQAQFEKAIQVGAKTVVRWERGTVTQSRAVDGLVWIADNHPAVFERLAERNGVVIRRPAAAGTVVATASVAATSCPFPKPAGRPRVTSVKAGGIVWGVSPASPSQESA
jgi:HTH-type transcriptional regulator/antitoxin MqsA